MTKQYDKLKIVSEFFNRYMKDRNIDMKYDVDLNIPAIIATGTNGVSKPIPEAHIIRIQSPKFTIADLAHLAEKHVAMFVSAVES